MVKRASAIIITGHRRVLLPVKVQLSSNDHLPDQRKRLLQERGWVIFDEDPAIHDWVESALPMARRTLDTSEHSQWWRHGDTWFVGVNALPNDMFGAVPGGPALSGDAMDFLADTPAFNELPLDRAQVSVCRPGYPRQSPDQSDANHRYRVERDAAHIDGLLRRGPGNRRYLGEHHGYILGIPMVEFDAGAAPFVVWEGSHRLALAAFRQIFNDLPAHRWQDMDLTDRYHALRRQVFAQCVRKEIHAIPGQCFLVHRMALHGMAPWKPRAQAGADGRMICYFRPELSDPALWLELP